MNTSSRPAGEPKDGRPDPDDLATSSASKSAAISGATRTTRVAAPSATETDADTEAQADEIARTSPEGRPADPSVRGRTTIIIMVVAFVIVAVAAGLAARSGSPGLAIGIVVVGVVIVLIANPVAWASIMRVRSARKFTTSRRPGRVEQRFMIVSCGPQ
jgi:hypothetical protein